MKRILSKAVSFILVLSLMFAIATSLTGCSGDADKGAATDVKSTETTDVKPTTEAPEVKEIVLTENVKIGVAIYDSVDTEVLAFQAYYKEYIEKNLTNVEFIYSSTIDNTEKEIAFIESCKAQGVQGIISFVSQDTISAINKCEQLEMYYIKGAGSVSDEIFDQVKTMEFFVGTIGPSLETEKTVGYNMAKYFIEQNAGENKNFVIHAGFIDRVEMHRARLAGIVEAFAEVGVTYSRTDTEMTTELGTFDVGSTGYTIDIFKGVPIDPATFFPLANQKIGADGVQVMMSVLSGYDFLAAPVNGAEEAKGTDIKVSAICSYTDAYFTAFEDGKVDYVAAKYAAQSGPVFAAIYNAITGYSEEFRDNGNAFRLEQGYWVSTNKEEYGTSYELATSLEKPAYTVAALKSVIKEYNPDATLVDLKALTEAWDLEQVNQRLEKEVE